MLNHAIVAAFLATTAAAFGVAPAQAEGPRCEASQPAPDRAGGPAGRPLGTVDAPPRNGCEWPRSVRA
jgi:hypothetical protein